MGLSIRGEQQTEQPTEQQIDEAIRSLDGQGDSFVILSSDAEEGGFVQAAGGPDQFVVEYCEGSDGRHWQSAGEQPADVVIRLFLAFKRCDNSYKTAIPWRDFREVVDQLAWEDPMPGH